jgi:hypothetical protein
MDNRSREPGPVLKLSVVTVGLAAGLGMMFFPIPVLVLGSGFLIFPRAFAWALERAYRCWPWIHRSRFPLV